MWLLLLLLLLSFFVAAVAAAAAAAAVKFVNKGLFRLTVLRVVQVVGLVKALEFGKVFCSIRVFSVYSPVNLVSFWGHAHGRNCSSNNRNSNHNFDKDNQKRLSQRFLAAPCFVATPLAAILLRSATSAP